MISEVMITAVGFRYCLLICAAILLTNIVIGVIFTRGPPSNPQDALIQTDEVQKDMRRISLKIWGELWTLVALEGEPLEHRLPLP